MNDPKGPVLIDIEEDAPHVPVTEVEAVPDPVPQGDAMQSIAALAARPPNRLARWFWRSFAAVALFVLSVAAWDFVTNLIIRSPILGGIAFTLIGLFLLVCLALMIREWAALLRLSRIDSLRAAAEAARSANEMPAAKRVVKQLRSLYGAREDLRWGLAKLDEREIEQLDADALLDLAEHALMEPLDAVAEREVEIAARRVATATALIPIALADVVAALTANIAMIRRIAEIYGGRGGTLGSWRLTRAVFAHLVATGAVAVGDDLIGSIAGGGLLSKVSRRFGEGLINGALTARVGLAAMEVCRPLPFDARSKPSVSGTITRALTGLFDTKGNAP